jgi:hypothetical protein
MNALPVMSDTLEFHTSGDDVLVHDMRSRKIHVLNASAATVLRLCDGSHDERTIAARLSDANDELVVADVRSILEQFQNLGLLSFSRP